jgi:hypothetical protein
MATRVIAAVVAALALAGCGGSAEDSDAPREGRPKPEPGGAELAVVVRPEGPSGPAKVTRISCDALGNEASRPACRRLGGLERNHLAPVSPRQACTQVYGGPAVASVKGTLRGEPVSEHFSLRNGCEIARWKRNADLLGPPVGSPPAPPG